MIINTELITRSALLSISRKETIHESSSLRTNKQHLEHICVYGRGGNSHLRDMFVGGRQIIIKNK
jgi:hypothetical protein